MDTGRFLVLLGELATFEGRISILWPKVAFLHMRADADCFNLSSDARRERSGRLGESANTIGRPRNALCIFAISGMSSAEHSATKDHVAGTAPQGAPQPLR